MYLDIVFVRWLYGTGRASGFCCEVIATYIRCLLRGDYFCSVIGILYTAACVFAKRPGHVFPGFSGIFFSQNWNRFTTKKTLALQ